MNNGMVHPGDQPSAAGDAGNSGAVACLLTALRGQAGRFIASFSAPSKSCAAAHHAAADMIDMQSFLRTNTPIDGPLAP